MAITSISSNISDISSYDSRMITITVTGIRKQFVRLANQTIHVPYSRLSQTIHNIHRSGGNIVDMSSSSMNSGTSIELSLHNNQSNAELVELETPVTIEKVEVASASHNIEEVVHVEAQKATTPGRSKRQNSSHGSKKKKR
jgi:ribosomal protein S8